jgi:hypothetical protein
MLPTSPAGALIGTTTTMIKSRSVVVPAGSYANAFILTGADAEVGGRGNVPVMVQVDLNWQGPGGASLPMRNARLIGTANAMAGPERVAIDLTLLSYTLKSGREVNAKCVGYVADNQEGQYGARGVYKWNVRKVLPLSIAAGFGEGASDTLKAQTTQQIVTTTGTVTAATSSEDILKNAAYAGGAEGFGILADYVKDVLKDVRPSVSVKNGERISVWLGEPVELALTENEYNQEVTGVTMGGFGP